MIYIYIHIIYTYVTYICIYIYIYKSGRKVISHLRHTKCSNLTEIRWGQHICDQENKVTSPWLSTQWLCGNSSTWGRHDTCDVHWPASLFIRICLKSDHS